MGRLKTHFAIIAASLLIASTAILAATVFLIIAAYLALTTVMAPWAAALATAGAAIVFAILVMVIARLATRGRRVFDTQTAATAMGGLLGKQMRGFAKGNGVVGLAIAVVAGFAIGVSPRLRNILLKIL